MEKGLSGSERTWRKVRRSPAGILDSERDGLEALGATRTVGVCAVLGYGKGPEGEWLETERLLPPGPNLDYRALGRDLARLHLMEMGPTYGYQRDNFIGDTPQTNTWAGNWWEFFAEMRIGFQTRMARDKGGVSASEARRLEVLASRVQARWATLAVRPSLLHGDLWGGNHLMHPSGRGVLIDPAVYLGHSEADLAMTKLFGGFPSSFYAGYDEILPPQAERGERFLYYNLYHLLNHVNLFGEAYHGQLLASLRRLE